MAANNEQSSFRALAYILAILIPITATLAGAYSLLTRSRHEYVMKRNSRLLAVAGAQLSDTVDPLREVVATTGRALVKGVKKKCSFDVAELECRNKVPFDDSKRPPFNSPTVSTYLVRENRDLALYFSYHCDSDRFVKDPKECPQPATRCSDKGALCARSSLAKGD